MGLGLGPNGAVFPVLYCAAAVAAARGLGRTSAAVAVWGLSLLLVQQVWSPHSLLRLYVLWGCCRNAGFGST